jgi:cell division protein FtsB
VNKALNSAAYDEADLVQQVESGSVKLGAVKEAELPDNLRSLDAPQRQAKLDQLIAERKQLRQQILNLSKQREQYLAEQRSKQGLGKTGFDAAVQAALDKQIK